MKYIKNILFLIVLNISILHASSDLIHDTTYAVNMMEKGNAVYRSNIDSARIYWSNANSNANYALKDSLRMKDKVKKVFLTVQVNSLGNLAYVYGKLGEQEKSLNMYRASIVGLSQLEEYEDLSNVYNNMALEYNYRGMLDTALYYYGLSLDLRESINDSIGIAESHNNLATIYLSQGEDSLALSYHYKALSIFQMLNYSDGIGMSYSHIGNHFRRARDLDSALFYFNSSIIFYEKINYVGGQSSSYNNIGSIYLNMDEIDSALFYYNKALELAQFQKNKKRICNISINIAKAYYLKSNIELSLYYATSSLKLAQELSYPSYIGGVALIKSDIYTDQKKYLEALEMYKLHIEMRDSVKNKNTQKASAQQQAKYEYEKQKQIDDVEHDKLLAIEQEKKENQQILTGLTAGGLGLVTLFLFFVANRLSATKKQKKVIENQKRVVEFAHEALEEKNREIMDSITYAKRIQSAILPPNKIVKEYLKESFILYKPKDVVAGDFYWMEHKDGKVLYAAADCTGHGVPGAMVSVICNNGLNRSVREFGLTDPGEILDKTRGIVIQEFEKSEEEVKDGMDIALCSIEGKKLQYAGAHNPLWIIRKGEIIETKANKQPIGKFDNNESYTTHNFDLEAGDTIYIFSDGYVDQFGGKKGKKFKAKAFRELLLSIQKNSMSEQKNILDESFEKWRGELEQLDDVCVIGVRI